MWRRENAGSEVDIARKAACVCMEAGTRGAEAGSGCEVVKLPRTLCFKGCF